MNNASTKYATGFLNFCNLTFTHVYGNAIFVTIFKWDALIYGGPEGSTQTKTSQRKLIFEFRKQKCHNANKRKSQRKQKSHNANKKKSQRKQKKSQRKQKKVTTQTKK